MLEEIAEILEKRRIKRVPVIHDGSLSASSAGPISCTARRPPNRCSFN
jgi:CBS domain-containing protein